MEYGIEIATDDAISSALIVNELVANAAKYAYPHGSGEIWVTVQCSGESGFSISVRDAGAGLPQGFEPGKTKGLGMQLVNALAQQLGGTLEIHTLNPGAEFVVSAPSKRRPSSAEMPGTHLEAIGAKPSPIEI